MSRAPFILLTTLLLVTSPFQVRADEGDREALLTLEGEAALRDLLWSRVLLVTSRRPPEALEDLSLLPERYGQAVRVTREGRTEVLAAGPLVDGGGEVRVARAVVAGDTVAKAGPVDEASLLAVLHCDGACATASALEAAPPQAWEPRRLLFFVVPALAERPILGHTSSLGRQAEPFEAMIAVAGRLPHGTVLFDARGRPVAVTVRGMPTRTDRTLAAVLMLPKPEVPGDGGADKGGAEEGGADKGGAKTDAARRRELLRRNEANATGDATGATGATGTTEATDGAVPGPPAATPDRLFKTPDPRSDAPGSSPLGGAP